MQVTNYREIVYFPPEESPQEKPIDHVQIRIFREFSEFLKTNSQMEINLDSGLHEVTKDAIAFFVESMKQLNGNTWQNKIQEVKERIQNLSPMETTWLLNDLISNLYKTSITMQILHKDTETKRKEFLVKAVACWDSSQELRSMLKEENEEVCIGGIVISMLPRWYTENFITKE